MSRSSGKASRNVLPTMCVRPTSCSHSGLAIWKTWSAPVSNAVATGACSSRLFRSFSMTARRCSVSTRDWAVAVMLGELPKVVAVGFFERQPRAHAEHDVPRRRLIDARRDARHEGMRHRLGPWIAAAGHGLRQRLGGRFARQFNEAIADRRIHRQAVVLIDADRLHERRSLRIGIVAIQEGEGHVGRLASEHGGGALEHRRLAGRKHRALDQRAQRAQPPLAHHARCRLGADDERAANAARLVEHRRISVGPVALFDPPVAKDRDERVLVPARFRASHDIVDLRPDDGPDLPPAVGAPLAHRRRVFAVSEAGKVRVVVELDEIRAPPEEHRVT